MPQFAIPTPDENLQPAWTVQGTGGSQSTTGIPGQGYATSAAIPAGTALGSASQAGAGVPYPPKAEDIGAENDGAAGVSVLSNPGYADGTTLMTSATAPVPGLTAAQQPFGMNANATVVYPSGTTAIYVAPFSPVAPSGTGAPWIAILSGNAAAGTINFSIPPAGWIKTTGAAATSASYQATN